MTLQVLGCRLRNPTFSGLTRAAFIAMACWLLVDAVPALAFGHVSPGMVGSCLLSVLTGSLAAECGVVVYRGFNHVLLLVACLAGVQLMYWAVLLAL